MIIKKIISVFLIFLLSFNPNFVLADREESNINSLINKMRYLKGKEFEKFLNSTFVVCTKTGEKTGDIYKFDCLLRVKNGTELTFSFDGPMGKEIKFLGFYSSLDVVHTATQANKLSFKFLEGGSDLFSILVKAEFEPTIKVKGKGTNLFTGHFPFDDGINFYYATNEEIKAMLETASTLDELERLKKLFNYFDVSYSIVEITASNKEVENYLKSLTKEEIQDLIFQRSKSVFINGRQCEVRFLENNIQLGGECGWGKVELRFDVKYDLNKINLEEKIDQYYSHFNKIYEDALKVIIVGGSVANVALVSKMLYEKYEEKKLIENLPYLIVREEDFYNSIEELKSLMKEALTSNPLLESYALIAVFDDGKVEILEKGVGSFGSAAAFKKVENLENVRALIYFHSHPNGGLGFSAGDISALFYRIRDTQKPSISVVGVLVGDEIKLKAARIVEIKSKEGLKELAKAAGSHLPAEDFFENVKFEESPVLPIRYDDLPYLKIWEEESNLIKVFSKKIKNLDDVGKIYFYGNIGKLVENAEEWSKKGIISENTFLKIKNLGSQLYSLGERSFWLYVPREYNLEIEKISGWLQEEDLSAKLIENFELYRSKKLYYVSQTTIEEILKKYLLDKNNKAVITIDGELLKDADLFENEVLKIDINDFKKWLDENKEIVNEILKNRLELCSSEYKKFLDELNEIRENIVRQTKEDLMEIVAPRLAPKFNEEYYKELTKEKISESLKEFIATEALEHDIKELKRLFNILGIPISDEEALKLLEDQYLNKGLTTLSLSSGEAKAVLVTNAVSDQKVNIKVKSTNLVCEDGCSMPSSRLISASVESQINLRDVLEGKPKLINNLGLILEGNKIKVVKINPNVISDAVINDWSQVEVLTDEGVKIYSAAVGELKPGYYVTFTSNFPEIVNRGFGDMVYVIDPKIIENEAYVVRPWGTIFEVDFVSDKPFSFDYIKQIIVTNQESYESLIKNYGELPFGEGRKLKDILIPMSRDDVVGYLENFKYHFFRGEKSEIFESLLKQNGFGNPEGSHFFVGIEDRSLQGNLEKIKELLKKYSTPSKILSITDPEVGQELKLRNILETNLEKLIPLENGEEVLIDGYKFNLKGGKLEVITPEGKVRLFDNPFKKMKEIPIGLEESEKIKITQTLHELSSKESETLLSGEWVIKGDYGFVLNEGRIQAYPKQFAGEELSNLKGIVEPVFEEEVPRFTLKGSELPSELGGKISNIDFIPTVKTKLLGETSLLYNAEVTFSDGKTVKVTFNPLKTEEIEVGGLGFLRFGSVSQTDFLAKMNNLAEGASEIIKTSKGAFVVKKVPEGFQLFDATGTKVLGVVENVDKLLKTSEIAGEISQGTLKMLTEVDTSFLTKAYKTLGVFDIALIVLIPASMKAREYFLGAEYYPSEIERQFVYETVENLLVEPIVLAAAKEFGAKAIGGALGGLATAGIFAAAIAAEVFVEGCIEEQIAISKLQSLGVKTAYSNGLEAAIGTNFIIKAFTTPPEENAFKNSLLYRSLYSVSLEEDLKTTIPKIEEEVDRKIGGKLEKIKSSMEKMIEDNLQQYNDGEFSYVRDGNKIIITSPTGYSITYKIESDDTIFENYDREIPITEAIPSNLKPIIAARIGKSVEKLTLEDIETFCENVEVASTPEIMGWCSDVSIGKTYHETISVEDYLIYLKRNTEYKLDKYIDVSSLTDLIRFSLNADTSDSILQKAREKAIELNNKNPEIKNILGREISAEDLLSVVAKYISVNPQSDPRFNYLKLMVANVMRKKENEITPEDMRKFCEENFTRSPHQLAEIAYLCNSLIQTLKIEETLNKFSCSSPKDCTNSICLKDKEEERGSCIYCDKSRKGAVAKDVYDNFYACELEGNELKWVLKLLKQCENSRECFGGDICYEKDNLKFCVPCKEEYLNFRVFDTEKTFFECKKEDNNYYWKRITKLCKSTSECYSGEICKIVSGESYCDKCIPENEGQGVVETSNRVFMCYNGVWTSCNEKIENKVILANNQIYVCKNINGNFEWQKVGQYCEKTEECENGICIFSICRPCTKELEGYIHENYICFGEKWIKCDEKAEGSEITIYLKTETEKTNFTTVCYNGNWVDKDSPALKILGPWLNTAECPSSAGSITFHDLCDYGFLFGIKIDGYDAPGGGQTDNSKQCITVGSHTITATGFSPLDFYLSAGQNLDLYFVCPEKKIITSLEERGKTKTFQISEIKIQPENPRSYDDVKLSAKASNSISNIVSCEVSLDRLPYEKISGSFGSKEVTIEINLGKLKDGSHSATIRCIDETSTVATNSYNFEVIGAPSCSFTASVKSERGPFASTLTASFSNLPAEIKKAKIKCSDKEMEKEVDIVEGKASLICNYPEVSEKTVYNAQAYAGTASCSVEMTDLPTCKGYLGIECAPDKPIKATVSISNCEGLKWNVRYYTLTSEPILDYCEGSITSNSFSSSCQTSSPASQYPIGNQLTTYKLYVWDGVNWNSLKLLASQDVDCRNEVNIPIQSTTTLPTTTLPACPSSCSCKQSEQCTGNYECKVYSGCEGIYHGCCCCPKPTTTIPACTKNSDCCTLGLEGSYVKCYNGVCDLCAPPYTGCYQCPAITTTTITTTTTLPACPQCSYLTYSCKCGSATCGSGSYCCPTKNTCYPDSSTCNSNCAPATTTTSTTTTTLPACTYKKCEQANTATCICNATYNTVCYKNLEPYCCAANNACYETQSACRTGSCAPTTTTLQPTTTTISTTTTLPACAYTNCQQWVSNCKCGTGNCYSYGGYCCAAVNTCFTYQSTCQQYCGISTTITTTTLLLPSCPHHCTYGQTCSIGLSGTCVSGYSCPPGYDCCCQAGTTSIAGILSSLWNFIKNLFRI